MEPAREETGSAAPLPTSGGSGASAPPLALPTSQEDEIIKKKLFKSAMEGKWVEVVNLYKEHPELQESKITRTGDTALHIAVWNEEADIVEDLVNLLSSDSSEEPLKVKNERGNTPLHVAASLGIVRMCKCIARKFKDSQPIGARNKEGETPFFLAALHGKKEAFLCLHSICGSTDQGYLYCRRNDGETVLHSAINGDYFDLAFQIIRKYENLVNYVDQHGLSPLHLLASKPTAFRSGSHLVRFNLLIYHCIFVDALKVEEINNDRPDDTLNHFKDGNNNPTHPQKFHTRIHCENQSYPENYLTCITFFRLLRKIYHVLVPRRKYTKKNDEEANNKGQFNRNKQDTGQQSSNQSDHGHQLFPINYDTCFDSIKFISKATMIILGFGSREIKKIEEKKEKHTWSIQIMDELLKRATEYEYEDNGQKPQQYLTSSKLGETETSPYALVEVGNPPETSQLATDKSPPSEAPKESQGVKNEGKNGDAAEEEKNGRAKETPILVGAKRETPILVAAKNGITEMVEKILERFPVAIHDINTDKKNMVLLAVENRQPHVYQFLWERKTVRDSVFRKVDKNGNSALHLAAKRGEHRPCRIPGAALQMQWEIKWFEFVKESMPMHFFARYNQASETAREVFTKSHSKLLEEGGKWLTSTSESCSVVAALIATVAFATSTTVPGGVMEGKGTPTLERETPFSIFAISSLIALCFSVTSMIMFLAILTSRYQERDFGVGLPRKLLVGLTSLFISITAMLISFCAGHFFVLKDKLKFAALPVYLVTCLPVTFFAVAQFPLYFDLIWATFRKVPQRSYKAVPV